MDERRGDLPAEPLLARHEGVRRRPPRRRARARRPDLHRLEARQRRLRPLRRASLGAARRTPTRCPMVIAQVDESLVARARRRLHARLRDRQVRRVHAAAARPRGVRPDRLRRCTDADAQAGLGRAREGAARHQDPVVDQGGDRRRCIRTTCAACSASRDPPPEAEKIAELPQHADPGRRHDPDRRRRALAAAREAAARSRAASTSASTPSSAGRGWRSCGATASSTAAARRSIAGHSMAAAWTGVDADRPRDHRRQPALRARTTRSTCCTRAR